MDVNRTCINQYYYYGGNARLAYTRDNRVGGRHVTLSGRAHDTRLISNSSRLIDAGRALVAFIVFFVKKTCRIFRRENITRSTPRRIVRVVGFPKAVGALTRRTCFQAGPALGGGHNGAFF